MSVITFLEPGQTPPLVKQRSKYEDLRQQLAQRVGIWGLVADAPYSEGGRNNRFAMGLQSSSPEGHPELVIKCAVRTSKREGFTKVYARAVYVGPEPHE